MRLQCKKITAEHAESAEKNKKYAACGKKQEFNRMAAENDLVLIYFEDKPLVFARIEEILPNSKPDWYHVRLLLLQVPLQIVTWILRDVYIGGAEFTMNGKRMRLEKVVVPEPVSPPETTQNQETTGDTAGQSGNAKVISLKGKIKKEGLK